VLATIATSEEIPQGPFIVLEYVICYGAFLSFGIQFLNYYSHEAETI